MCEWARTHQATFVRDGLSEQDFPVADGRSFAGVGCADALEAGELLLRLPLECCCRPISADPDLGDDTAEAIGLKRLATGLSDGAGENTDAAAASIDIAPGVIELVFRVLLSTGRLWDLYRQKLAVYRRVHHSGHAACGLSSNIMALITFDFWCRSPIPEAFTTAELDALQYDKLKELVLARRGWVDRTVEQLPWAEAGFGTVDRDSFLKVSRRYCLSLVFSLLFVAQTGTFPRGSYSSVKALHFVRSRAFSIHQHDSATGDVGADGPPVPVRHRLCLVFLLPSWRRHYLCLVCSITFVAKTSPFLADFQPCLAQVGTHRAFCCCPWLLPLPLPPLYRIPLTFRLPLCGHVHS